LASAKSPLRPEQLEGERVLLLEDGHCFREQALSLCTHAGAREASDYRATSLSTLVQMTASGAGVTLLPVLTLELENRRQSLHVRPFSAKVRGRTLALVWRKNSALAAALEAVGKTMQSVYTQCTRKRRVG
jgi:LysR family hydrogen peroxide-inducible transcriptional activator